MELLTAINSNLLRFESLKNRIPTYLHEKEFAFCEVTQYLVSESDIEDGISEEDVRILLSEAIGHMDYIERRAIKLGY